MTTERTWGISEVGNEDAAVWSWYKLTKFRSQDIFVNGQFSSALTFENVYLAKTCARWWLVLACHARINTRSQPPRHFILGAHTHIHTHKPSLFLSLSLSHTHTHNTFTICRPRCAIGARVPPHPPPHTHTHTHTHTHLQHTHRTMRHWGQSTPPPHIQTHTHIWIPRITLAQPYELCQIKTFERPALPMCL